MVMEHLAGAGRREDQRKRMLHSEERGPHVDRRDVGERRGYEIIIGPGADILGEGPLILGTTLEEMIHWCWQPASGGRLQLEDIVGAIGPHPQIRS
jgi:hypothetical protein